ncbi:MAG: hypothetical protein ACOCW2_03925 [Chitinivibrionales bacterium]
MSLFLLTGCAARSHTETQSFIHVENKTIRLMPLKGADSLAACSEWPDDVAQQKVLLSELHNFYSRITDYFHHQQKKYLYTLVDSTYPAEISLTFTLSTQCFSADTLFLPLIVNIHSDDTIQTCTIPACGLTDSPTTAPFRRWGTALADYRRHFPYSELSRFFHPVIIH